jgi:hypothetical protein
VMLPFPRSEPRLARGSRTGQASHVVNSAAKAFYRAIPGSFVSAGESPRALTRWDQVWRKSGRKRNFSVPRNRTVLSPLPFAFSPRLSSGFVRRALGEIDLGQAEAPHQPGNSPLLGHGEASPERRLLVKKRVTYVQRRHSEPGISHG